MRILIIHNSQDKVRSENILKQFADQSTKYDYETVEAIMLPSQPSVGIKRSFCKAIQIAKDYGWKQVFILEDDFCCLDMQSIEIMIRTYNEFPLHGAILLGGIYEGQIEEVGKNIAKVNDKLSGLHAMIVGEELYDEILSCPEPYHLDYSLSMIRNFPIYTCYPFVIIQNDGFSYNTKSITNYNEGLKLKYKLIN